MFCRLLVLILLLIKTPACYEGFDYAPPNVPSTTQKNTSGKKPGNKTSKVPTHVALFFVQPDRLTLKTRTGWSTRLVQKRIDSWKTMGDMISSELEKLVPGIYSDTTELSVSLESNGNNNGNQNSASTSALFFDDNNNQDPLTAPNFQTGSDYNSSLSNEPLPFADLAEVPAPRHLVRIRVIFDYGEHQETPTEQAIWPNQAMWESVAGSGSLLFLTYFCQEDIDQLPPRYFSLYATQENPANSLYCLNPFDQAFLSRDDAGANRLIEQAANQDALRLIGWIQKKLIGL